MELFITSIEDSIDSNSDMFYGSHCLKFHKDSYCELGPVLNGERIVASVRSQELDFSSEH